ncbi:hypothetical protein LAUMK42_02637 [Mycobacterium persicum]|uniref:Uncharacterized protein n=1 Tax=Mycobacterium persicum TaxID=1487726 RepID=A0AB38UT38_9MYCO|nr:hypothetical protein LAUMK42_02637 [Mycobacterium persicum]
MLGSSEISPANVFCAAPAEVATAWVTAADWVAAAAGLVMCGGGVYGVSCAALAEEPA